MSRLTRTQATAVAITGLVTGLTLGHTAGVIARANADVIDGIDIDNLPACTAAGEPPAGAIACVDNPPAHDPEEILLDDQEEPGAVAIADGTRDGLPVTASQAEAIAASSDPQTLIRAIRSEVAANRLRAQLARERKAHRAEVARLRGARTSGWTPALNRMMARGLAAQAGWTGAQWRCLDRLVMRESRWVHTARNPTSGAYGIPQSLPAGKMATIGGDWKTNPVTQVRWQIRYIRGRYGTPCGALAHSNRLGWY